MKIFVKSQAPTLFGEPMKYVIIFGHLWLCWSTVRFRIIIEIC